MKNYIELDAHSATSTFVNMDYKGEVISRQRVDTTETNLIGFVRSQNGEKKLTFEESNLSKWLRPLIFSLTKYTFLCTFVR